MWTGTTNGATTTTTTTGAGAAGGASGSGAGAGAATTAGLVAVKGGFLSTTVGIAVVATIAVVTVTAIAVGVGVGVVAGYYFVLHSFTNLNHDFYKGSIQAMYIDTIIHYGLIV